MTTKQKRNSSQLGLILVIIGFWGCASSASHTWRFNESRSASVVTENVVLQGLRPILYVFRDPADGQWIFLSEEKSAGEEIAIVRLEQIVKIDTSVQQLSSLPAGWKAWRESTDTPWHRSQLDRNRQ
jgi:hypothetical protein